MAHRLIGVFAPGSTPVARCYTSAGKGHTMASLAAASPMPTTGTVQPWQQATAVRAPKMCVVAGNAMRAWAKARASCLACMIRRASHSLEARALTILAHAAAIHAHAHQGKGSQAQAHSEQLAANANCTLFLPLPAKGVWAVRKSFRCRLCLDLRLLVR
jgi:hypothetical protein